MILYRLSTLEDSAWDLQAVRNTVDLLSVLDRTVDKLEQASNKSGEPSHDGLFMQLAWMMRMFRARVSSIMTHEMVDEELVWPYGGTATGTGGNKVDQSPMMTPPTDFENDKWLEEVLAGLK